MSRKGRYCQLWQTAAIPGLSLSEARNTANKYSAMIPKGIDIKNRVLKIDTELGYKWVAKPPPTTKYLSDKTKIFWEGKNLKAFDAYKFEW
ncbi:MAG: hypothetical protein IH917_03300 [Acidobacteria bacterium]|nr:hypothetical protein [Acidobacteriota bacterium]